MTRLARPVILSLPVILLASVAHAETFTESWYMLRGRANMKIGNHKAAIEAFEKAVEIDPDNQEAMRTLGVAYGQEGLTDKAIAQFDRYLAKWPKDAEIDFKQADVLTWSRYDYRRNDAIKYLKQGLDAKDDPRERRKLAKLLGRDRSTLDDALKQYETLLAASPKDDELRAEYRKLLSWDKKHLAAAIREHEAFAHDHPSDFAANHELARLLAQDPSRKDDAASLYGKLVTLRPKDGALHLERARVLASADRAPEAAAEYASVLKSRHDATIKTEYADVLATMPAERSKALATYHEVLAAQPKNDAVRLRYARLLGGEKADAAEAARQYEMVLAHRPNDAEAHRGAAKAYAWLGDDDRALMHAELGRDASLSEHLSQGREPRIGIKGEFLSQPAPPGAYGLTSYQSGLFVKRDVGPFVTLGAEIGGEGTTDGRYTSAGPDASVNGEYRFTQYRKIDLSYGYRGVGPSDRRSVWRVAVGLGDDSVSLMPGAEETFREDSLTSIAGATAPDGKTYGAARAEDGFFEITAGPDALQGTRLEVTPRAGFITTSAGDKNPFEELNGHVSHPLWVDGRLGLIAAYVLDVEHFQTDRSGFDPEATHQPLAGGYISPNLIFDQTPELRLRYGQPESLEAGLDAGPSLQVIRDVSAGTRVYLSAAASGYLEYRVDRLEVDVTASFVRIPGLNDQLAATLGVSWSF